MNQSCASCKHAVFKGDQCYGECVIHWCLDGLAHPIISKDWTCGSNCKDYYCYENLAGMISAHVAEVAKLTEERELMREARDILRAMVERTEALRIEVSTERDAAVAAKERAENILRYIADQHDKGMAGNWAVNQARAYFAAAQDAKPDHIGDATEMVRDRREQILIAEGNRPLTDEEHAIVDAGYERGKAILAEVRAEDRAERLKSALQEIFFIPQEQAHFAPAQYYGCVKSIAGRALEIDIRDAKPARRALEPEPWGGLEGEDA